MSHEEIQIAPGVFITDFRKNGNLLGLKGPQQPLTNDVGLLLDDCNALQSKCKMLEYTITELKQQENWEEDADFREAIEENWAVIIRFCGEMKEKVLRLYQLKYHPQTAKIQDLLNVDRIQTRQVQAKEELKRIIEKREEELRKQQISSSSEGIYL